MKTVFGYGKTKYRFVIALICALCLTISVFPTVWAAAEDSMPALNEEQTKDSDTVSDAETLGNIADGTSATENAGTDQTGTDQEGTGKTDTGNAETDKAENDSTGTDTSDSDASQQTEDLDGTGQQKAETELTYTSMVIYLWQEDELSLSGADDPQKITWSVGDTAVAAIRAKKASSDGSEADITGRSIVVTALSEGKTKITAEYGGQKYSCSVEVKKPQINYSYKLMNVGDKITLKVKGANIVSFVSDNSEIATAASSGKVTAKAAGSTTILLIDDNAEVYTCNLFVFDGDRLDTPSVTLRTVTDDLWLTTAIKAGDYTYERNTGLKLVKKTKKGYKVSVGDQTFEISSSYVTNVCPAVTPTPAASVADTSFKVEAGMLVNYTSNLMYSGTPKNLVYLKDSDITRNFSYDSSCRLQKEVIEPLSSMIDAAVKDGETWFAVDETGAYRTFALQDSYWKARLAGTPTYGDDPYHNGGTKCVPAVSSEHRTGYAIDILANPSGYVWLNANCYKYGFILRYTGDKTEYTGVMDEYWHYTYVGEGVAYTCYTEGLCLEEYYMKYVDPAATIPFD